MNRALLLAGMALVLMNGAAQAWPFDGVATPGSQQATQEQKLKTADQVGEFVVEAMEDSQGNLWFGTMTKGAARFDGTTLTYFTTDDGLVSNTVANITEDSHGQLWFGTHTGASRFDGKSFTTFGIDEGLHGAGCQFLVDADDNLWAGTNHGVFRFDGTSFTQFELPTPEIQNPTYKWELGKVWCLMQDSQGDIWFGRDGYGACRFDGEMFKHFTKDDGLCSNNVSQIVEDRQGNIWFGSLTSDLPQPVKDGGVSRYDGGSFAQFPEINGVSENDIYTIFADSQGHVWIGATGTGVYRYDGQDFTLFTKTDRPDLTRNFGVQATLEDKHGTLWFGFSGGLFRFEQTEFLNVTKAGPWK